MIKVPLDFSTGRSLGRVARVDTNRVLIEVDDHDALRRVTVSNLIAIQGHGPGEFAVAIVEGVVRATFEVLVEDEDVSESALADIARDQIRVALVGTFWSRHGDRVNQFKRGAHTFPQIDRECFLIEKESLQAFMSVLADDIGQDERLVLGKFVADADALAVADGNRLFQRHAALLGSTGAGKSWAVALILERAAKLKHENLIVLDVHGEYSPLVSPPEGDGIAVGRRIAGPGDADSTDATTLFLPYWLLNREELLAMLVDRSDQNAQNQVARFTHHVFELKREALLAAENDAVAATFTVDSPVPFSIKELIARLEADDTERIPGAKPPATRAGDFNGKLSRFIVRLQAKLDDRRLGFMFGGPAQDAPYSWMTEMVTGLMRSPSSEPGIKIVDLSEVPSDVLPIVAGVLARTLNDVQFWMKPQCRTPLCLVCDEAHLYLPVRETSDVVERRAIDVFERIAKEGRKYGMALMVVSQRPADVSRTILSQCNNFIALRLTNDQDQAVVRRLMPDSLAGLTDVLPLLDTGEALILGDALLLPTRVKFDAPKIRPDSSTRAFWAEWNSDCPDDAAIAAGVESFRRQMRQ